MFAAISNQVAGVEGLAESPFIGNWIEIACISAEICNISVEFRGEDGSSLATQALQMDPKSQFHFNGAGLLPANSNGSVVIASDRPLVAQSMSYVHGTNNSLQTGFVSPARTRGRAEQAGSINTFLDMQAVLFSFGTVDGPVEATYNATSFSGGTYSGVLGLNSGGSSALGLNDDTLSFPKDSYGSLTVETTDDGLALSEVRRVRISSKGVVDFVMPTLMK